MNRRSFLCRSVAKGAGLLVGARVWAAEALAGEEKVILSAPVTHSDWMLKPGIPAGESGVRHMLDACKACGWSRVYWRVLDGGRSLYKSRLMRPQGKWDDDSFWNPQSAEDRKLAERFTGGMPAPKLEELRRKLDALDYTSFDPLAAAVAYGHRIGVEVHAWVTINEDDHGWGLQSEFSKRHPEMRWRRRDGRAYHSQLSFAFAEVRAYKLAIIEELLGGYDLDGLFLDWIRTGDVRDNPQTDAQGVADSGYEGPVVEEFRKRFGVDPHEVANGDERWVRVRAEPQTVFMREVRRRVAGHRRKIPVAVMVAHPWHYRGLQDKIDGSLRGLLLDVGAWGREGLIDAAVAAGYYRDGGTAERAWRALREEVGEKVDVWTYAWVPQNVEEFSRDADLAGRLGARQVLLWEGDYIDDRANAGELKEAMRARAGM